MYLPKHFEAPSREAIESLVRDYPLAQIVTIDADGEWVCNPLPLLVRDTLDVGASLIGHVARANPIWQHRGPVLVIFTGPSAYITPNAYPSKAEHHRVVPTYNYATVQVRGHLIANEDTSKKLAAVTDLTDFAEQSQLTPWAVADAPEDFVQANLRAIVAIEIRIESVIAKFKLSQNRTVADRGGVVDYLAKRESDQDAAAMLKLMQSIADKKTNKS